MAKTFKIISWNVNGIRAAHRKGLIDFIKKEDPDILCVQEAKAMIEQLPEELINVEGYHFYMSSAERKGYSGVAIFTKHKPNKVATTFGRSYKDNEGRILSLEFDDFTLFNIYFPNGGGESHRFDYKLEFYNETLKYMKRLKKKTNVILCGDINAAHTEIDLARPKDNQKSIGFLPVEREWITNFLNAGFLDTFRVFNKDGGNYSWWDMKTRARERNVGWRIDYFFVNTEIEKNLKEASILSDVLGSDHCPTLIKVDF